MTRDEALEAVKAECRNDSDEMVQVRILAELRYVAGLLEQQVRPVNVHMSTTVLGGET